jgi:hypothetical protein
MSLIEHWNRGGDGEEGESQCRKTRETREEKEWASTGGALAVPQVISLVLHLTERNAAETNIVTTAQRTNTEYCLYR